MKNLASWFVALVAAFALSLVAPTTAAASTSVDPAHPCSLTIRKYLVSDGDAASGAPDADAVFALGRVPGIDLTTTEGWRAAVVLADQDPAAIAADPVARGATDANGEVAFRNLDIGLYKVTEIAVGNSPSVAPFLVTLPMTDPESRDGWLYDVVAYPKATPPHSADEPIYDLALRTWVSEVWRDGTRVFERHSPTTHPGPDFAIPHETFDDPTVDIVVGDLVVHDIHLFNQGNRTARVEELVNHSSAGLGYAHSRLMDTVPGHNNDGWQLAGDGLWHMSMEEAGIVLAPGEEFEVHLTLEVLPDALSAGADEADHPSFVGISRFSGWVPAISGASTASTASPASASAASAATASTFGATAQPLAQTTYDGVPGAWQEVPDADSFPGRDNPALENGQLVYHSWEDNEIHESNTSMTPDDHLTDHDNDDDDHDGAIIRVVRVGRQIQSWSTSGLPVTGAEIGAAVAAAVVLVTAGAAIVRTAVRRNGSKDAAVDA